MRYLYFIGLYLILGVSTHIELILLEVELNLPFIFLYIQHGGFMEIQTFNIEYWVNSHVTWQIQLEFIPSHLFKDYKWTILY